jgi:hypothetical protein
VPEQRQPEPVAARVAAPEPEPEYEPELRFELTERDAPWELEVRDDDPTDAGVTPSADWNYDIDDDAASYAGPV